MNSVTTIKALGDNFTYLYQYDQNSALVVDPSNAASVMRIIKERRLNLTMILITHHHWDHTAGTAELKKKTACQLIGGDKQRIPGIDRVVDDGQVLTAGNTKIQVIATPGHTHTAVCYYMPPSNGEKHGILWTGDTLFAGGCGRVFECDAKTMLDSLLKLASLPDQTLVYPGHDYTLENYKFALSIEPDNEAVKQRLQQVRQALSQGGQTVPSTILQEKATNPFLRADIPELKTALNMPKAQAVEVFTELRRRKDAF
jgi:hydroxyacylglutathione hydrolase